MGRYPSERARSPDAELAGVIPYGPPALRWSYVCLMCGHPRGRHLVDPLVGAVCQVSAGRECPEICWPRRAQARDLGVATRGGFRPRHVA